MRALVVVMGLCAALLSAGCESCDPSVGDGGVLVGDGGASPLADSGSLDGGPLDGGSLDGGSLDGGDSGPTPVDGGGPDSGPEDGGASSGDASVVDASADGGDLAAPDGGAADASTGGDPDAGDVGVDPPCPSAGLAVRLTWSTLGDLDLHLSLEQAAWCSDEDCYWANCEVGADLFPVEWDGVNGHTAGDPLLVVDDTDGFGPEVICIEAPFIADYVVGARYNPYSLWPATDARVEVFSYGVLVDESALSALSPGEFWEPGHVSINASELSFVAAERRCAVSDAWTCQDAPGACPAP